MGEAATGAKITDAVREARRGWRAGSPMPENHDLQRNIRTAHLTAVDRIVHRFERSLTELPAHEIGGDDAAFAAAMRDFLDERLQILNGGALDHGTVTQTQVQEVLEGLAGEAGEEVLRNAAETAALAELVAHAGRSTPHRFQAMFRGPDGWYTAYTAFINHQITTNPKFRDVFIATNLIDIKSLIRKTGGAWSSKSSIELGRGWPKPPMKRSPNSWPRLTDGMPSAHMRRACRPKRLSNWRGGCRRRRVFTLSKRRTPPYPKRSISPSRSSQKAGAAATRTVSLTTFWLDWPI